MFLLLRVMKPCHISHLSFAVLRLVEIKRFHDNIRIAARVRDADDVQKPISHNPL